MREFIYYSGKAHTSGAFHNLMEAGRLDIACHTLIAAFFLSHGIRQNVQFHMIFMGPPDPPKHLFFRYHENMPISKKDVAGLIKRMLFKYKKGQLREAFPGCFIEKKSFLQLVEDLEAEGKQLYILDKKGRDIRGIESEKLKNAVFILGDHEGLPKHELRRIKKLEKISLGPEIYFASHALVILQNELDRRGIS